MKLTLLICALALFTVANAANLRARTLDPSIGTAAAPAKKDQKEAPKKLTKNKEAKELVDDDEKVYGDVDDPKGNCKKLRAKDEYVY